MFNIKKDTVKILKKKIDKYREAIETEKVNKRERKRKKKKK